VLLGLAFICLLIGFLLLGMGAMANKYEVKQLPCLWDVPYVILKVLS